jgi:hypothetical protein
MFVESRDSNTLKPAELDVVAQLGLELGLIPDESVIEFQVEQFPLVVLTSVDDELVGFLFGSLERIGGTPSILWALGCQRKVPKQHDVLGALTGELFRRAAISFPDEDVFVGGRFSHSGAYGLLHGLHDVVPRKGYKATGEERAWGRRLAKRFSCGGAYDDRRFVVEGDGSPQPIIDGRHAKPTKRVPEHLDELDLDRRDSLIGFGWIRAEELAVRLIAS